MKRILILGTGLIGASVGLALRSAGCTAQITGFDSSSAELEAALAIGAIDDIVATREAAFEAAREADLILIASPVLAILDWMRLLAPILGSHQLVTDVGSTKLTITRSAAEHFGRDRAHFLPGHPMAGKESGGAALADATLFHGAMWLFTPFEAPEPGSPAATLEAEWRAWIEKMGAHSMDLDPARHDELCAWVSHLPQMLSTAMAALLEDRFQDAPEISSIGGRALRETTRLGASPYSMWRDVALTNTEAIAGALDALEQELAHVRENLRTPELREEFLRANRFRSRRP